MKHRHDHSLNGQGLSPLTSAVPLPAPVAAVAEPHDHDHGHASGHSHSHDCDHGHTHGAIDPEITTSARGLWAVKWSFIGLLMTAVVQVCVFWLSGSIALLADLVHNVGDAATAIPLGLAFWVGRWRPTRQFAYGYGRAEDLAGMVVVAIIAMSAMFTGYESVERLLHPHALDHLDALVVAGIVGFVGNGAVSVFRIRVGNEIGSAALIADGYHARADSLVSLAVVLGAIGVAVGFPQADPVMGLGITAVLFHIVWDAGKTMLTRILDGVDPEITDKIYHAAVAVAAVKTVPSIRARWLGHRLYVEVAIALPPDVPI
ncbi:cation transporter, partial [filamentous cyanobacterium CCP5]